MYRSLFLYVLCCWNPCNGQPSSKQPSKPILDRSQIQDSFFLRDLRGGSQHDVQDFLNYHTFLDTPIDILRQFFGIGSQLPTNQRIPEFSDIVRRLILLSDKSQVEKKNSVNEHTQQRVSEIKNNSKLSNMVKESAAMRTGSKFSNFLKQTGHGIRQSIGLDPTRVNNQRVNPGTRGIPNENSKSIVRRGIINTIDTAGITGGLVMKDSLSSFNRGTASNDLLIQKVGRLSGLQTHRADHKIIQQIKQSVDQLRPPKVLLPDDDRVMQFIDNILARENTSVIANDSRITGSLRLDFPAAILDSRTGNKQTLGDFSFGITPATSPRPNGVHEQTTHVPSPFSAKDLNTAQHLVIKAKAQNEINNPLRNEPIFSETSNMATPTSTHLKSTIFLHWPEIPEVKQRITTEQTFGFTQPINNQFIVTAVPPFKTTLLPQNIFQTTPKHWHMDIVRPIVRGLSLESSPGQNLAGKSNYGQKTFVDISDHKGGSMVTDRVMDSRVIPDNTAQIISSISNTDLFSENKHVGVKTARSRSTPENTADMNLLVNMSNQKLITGNMPATVKTTRKEEITPPIDISASLLPISTPSGVAIDVSNKRTQMTQLGKGNRITNHLSTKRTKAVENKNGIENFVAKHVIGGSTRMQNVIQWPNVRQHMNDRSTSSSDGQVFSDILQRHLVKPNANVPTTNISGHSKLSSEMTNVFDNGLTELGHMARNVEHSLNQAHFDVINRLLKRWNDNIAIAQPVLNNIRNSNMFSLINSPRASDTFMNHQANIMQKNNPQLSRLVPLDSAPLLRNMKQGFKISSPTFIHATSTNSLKATPDDALLNNFYEQHQSLSELKTLPDLPSLPTVGMDYTPHIYSKGKFNNAIHKADILKVPAKVLGASQFNHHMVMPFSLDGNKVHTRFKGVTKSALFASKLRAVDC